MTGDSGLRTRIVRYHPGERFRRRLLFAFLIPSALALIFAMGRWHGLHSAQLLIDEAAFLRQALNEASAELAQTRQRAVGLQAGAEIDKEALTQVRSEVASERAKVARLEHEIMLFKSLMDTTVRVTGLALRGVELRSSSRKQEYHYRLTLLQRAENQKDLIGSMRISIIGSQSGKERILRLVEVDPALDQDTIAIEFRYFQIVEGMMELPDGFVPETIRVQADARGTGRYAIDRKVPWIVDQT